MQLLPFLLTHTVWRLRGINLFYEKLRVNIILSSYLFCFSTFLEDGQSFWSLFFRRKQFSFPSTKEENWNWNLLNNILNTSFFSLVVNLHFYLNATADLLRSSLYLTKTILAQTHFLSKNSTALTGRIKRWKPILFCLQYQEEKRLLEDLRSLKTKNSISHVFTFCIPKSLLAARSK